MPFEESTVWPISTSLFEGMVGSKFGFSVKPIITGIKGQQPELADTNNWRNWKLASGNHKHFFN
jgi:hypothetical protein